jgi:uncharacterized protein YjiS (DUF1127 family)
MTQEIEMTSAFTFTAFGTAVSAVGAALARGVMVAAVIPARLVKAVVQFIRATRNRFDVLQMLEMDDRMLRDIGLTRTDVTSALSSPAMMDPSTRLRIFAVERRAGNRAQARERMTEFKALQATEAAARCATASN